jgi:hypothetical protein
MPNQEGFHLASNLSMHLGDLSRAVTQAVPEPAAVPQLRPGPGGAVRAPACRMETPIPVRPRLRQKP